MKCKFCNQEPEYKPLKEMENLGVRVFFCFTCNAEYLVWQNGSIGTISLYTIINDKMYRWTDIQNGVVACYHIVRPGVPGESINESKIIFSLNPDQIKPDINPQNIAQKIRNYLLFL
jgi:hypothetical protein